MSFYKLCNEVAEAIEHEVSGLIGNPESGEILRIGADGTPTERIDEAAENAALCVLENDGRSMRFVSEELGEKLIGINPEFTFVLDPIDGTFNAVNNIPFFCVPIAIGGSSLSDVRYGYVKNLVNEDIYTAEKGKGSFLNGKSIHVSCISELPELSVISYSHRPNPIPINNHNVRRVRVFGCAALELCYIASGIFDAFFDMRNMLRVTDIAAGILIVEEAGGKVTDGKGMPLAVPFDVRKRANVIASNGYAHDKLLDFV
ncbi:MAG: bifunctional fructose-bisphosphatase/inositol-phosphate phosphatase [Candidatus Methanoperedens sp.]|nr:bifunctional fructose-bisphosphatase/inositol-phosphate phosphatase [Candidatus Methanoperedens sp.]MCE8424840.1 bifunctional fructose-bisphosphatase/inositol-phosphate phosphatase [Candidatus Methanoperedens sp.]MCE8428889.1 bifunctional fructose-bisphosphatase/inositol-phosphate phosphatase [Candidatus Methanoperedens sp.]